MSPIEIEIKKALLDARVRQIDIARKLVVSRQFINKVIKGQRPTKRVRKAIAKAVGQCVEDLWPQTNHKRKAA